MGCASSRESSPSQQPQTSQSPPIRATSNPAIVDSQTAINPPLSSATSRWNTSRSPLPQNISHSNLSSPRSSLQVASNRLSGTRNVQLNEHYNHPLAAPRPWVSTDRLWSRAQLRREREEFFHTRVTGHKELWDALRQITRCITEGNLMDAQGILDAAGITLPTGYLEDGAFDERGQLYSIPAPVLSDPMNILDDDNDTVIAKEEAFNKHLELDTADSQNLSNYTTAEEKMDKGKDALEKDAVSIKCRLSDRGGPDVIVHVGPSQPTKKLIRRLRSEADLALSTKVRLAYMGKVLDETLSLESQGWQQGHIVQVLVSGPP